MAQYIGILSMKKTKFLGINLDNNLSWGHC